MCDEENICQHDYHGPEHGKANTSVNGTEVSTKIWTFLVKKDFKAFLHASSSQSFIED